MDIGWWVASRASGLVALGLMGFSVALGLAMAAKAFRQPGVPRVLLAVHEHAALAVLVVASATPVLYLGVLRALPPTPAASRAGSG